MSAARLTVTAGGAPSDAQLAALTAAAAALLEAEAAAPADPLPSAYRSRWRRAGLLALLDGDPLVEDDGRWGPG